jgi:hypothetical protein
MSTIDMSILLNDPPQSITPNCKPEYAPFQMPSSRLIHNAGFTFVAHVLCAWREARPKDRQEREVKRTTEGCNSEFEESAK